MKKELLNFVNDDKDESRFRLNAISYLKHYTKNAFGKKIDRITIEFDQIFGHYCSISNNEIISRDFEGILTECQEKTEEFLSEVSRILCRELKAGHNGYERLEFKDACNTINAPFWLRELLEKSENENK